LAANVIKACDTEANQKELLSPLARATERAFKYTGLSTSTIKRIRQESKNRSESGSSSTLSTPGKHRPRPNERSINVDDFDLAVIRRTVHDFYVTNGTPSCPKLLPIIREKINFPSGVNSLRQILHRLGFRWKKCFKKRKFLIERPDIVNCIHLWIVGQLLRDYMMQYPGRQLSSYSLLWEPKISSRSFLPHLFKLNIQNHLGTSYPKYAVEKVSLNKQ
jgi:hypothetical protein